MRSRLGPHQLAFFRGVVLDGLDPIELAKRYLPVRPLERVVKAHVQWIRNELLITARRMRRRQFAKVVARPLPPSPPSDDRPTLDDFRQEKDPDGFYSEAELLELYNEAYPTKPDRRRDATRRTWAVRRLRQAIDAIERVAVEPPHPEDPVEAWLSDGVANALRHAGIRTLAELATIVDARGARWHTAVRGLGPLKAAAVALWLRANVPGFEERVGERALVPYKELRPALLAARRRETGVVPFEWFDVPSALDGRLSPYRRPPHAGGLPAVDDRDAVTRWLRTHLTAAELADPVKNSTYRAYRKEIERLWAWAVVERGKALSALDDDDVVAYTTFLYDPQPRAAWVGPKRPRWHPEWRPFTTVPSPRSRELSLTVVDALFEWWLRQGYIVRNPWRAGLKKERSKRAQFTRRSLSLSAWKAVLAAAAELPQGEKRARLRALLALLYATGLRREEAASATVQDLRRNEEADGTVSWELDVVGKGDRSRSVPVALPAIDALRDYFAYRFGEARLPVGEAPIPLFATLPAGAQGRASLSAWGINEAVVEPFRIAAREIEADHPEAAAELRSASAHWLRHTFATHAVKYDQASLATLQKILGHVSITTTASNYVDEDREMRRQVAMGVAERL